MFTELLMADSGTDDGLKRWQEEYTQLKEEFERYKLRAQSVLKNKKVCMTYFFQMFFQTCIDHLVIGFK